AFRDEIDAFLSGALDKSAPLRERAEEMTVGMAEDGAKFIRRLPELLAAWAGVLNTPELVAGAMEDPYYSQAKNAKSPNRIESTLRIFDCINCDKCVPVCPNDANFVYSLTPQRIEYRNPVLIAGGWKLVDAASILEVKKDHQLANFVDFCNECANCDTFCPEYGGPFIEKPSWFGSLASWTRDRKTDGFFVDIIESQRRMWGRMKGEEYYLVVDPILQRDTYISRLAEVEFMTETAGIYTVLRIGGKDGDVIDLNPYYTMKILMDGILATDRIHYVNTRFIPHRLAPTVG
ncbi:MAG: 4Fe-4S dicluster domain-containing protein, partial [Candidatus Hydrogenedentota bacterium]